jgi:ribonuclease P/MRP protein subunit RPP1
VLATFDIVAVQPNTESLLLKCCQSSEIDIISLDLAQRLSFPLKTSILSQAVDKGIFFEVNIASILKDSLSRRHLIANVGQLVRATRGRNLIFSSGATSAMLLRGPYDLVNLGSIFGIEGALLKRSLSENPRATILHAGAY